VLELPWLTLVSLLLECDGDRFVIVKMMNEVVGLQHEVETFHRFVDLQQLLA
jgi:hypothetical protein